MSQSRYAVTGKTAATAATIDVAICALWNPSTVKSVYVVEAHIFKQAVGAADEVKIRRISARGTPGSTATPTIANHYGHDIAPPSGVLLDMASYTVQPTFVGASNSGGDLLSTIIPAAIGAGIMWVFPDPIEVKAGAGLAMATGIALAMPVSRVTFKWEE